MQTPVFCGTFVLLLYPLCHPSQYALYIDFTGLFASLEQIVFCIRFDTALLSFRFPVMNVN